MQEQLRRLRWSDVLLTAWVVVGVLRVAVPGLAGIGAVLHGLIAAVALALAVRVSPAASRGRRSWALLCAAQICSVVWDVAYVSQHAEAVRVLRIWDVLYIANFVLVCVGLLTQPARAPSRAVQMRLELDVALIVTASSMIYGIVVLSGLRLYQSLELLPLLLYPVFDFVIICVLAAMLLRQISPSPAQLAYGFAMLFLTAADLATAASHAGIVNRYGGHWTAIASYAVSSLLTVKASWLYMRGVQWPTGLRHMPMKWRKASSKMSPVLAEFLLPYGWIVVAVGICVWYFGIFQIAPQQVDLYFIGICIGLILLISIARQWLTIEENARLAQWQLQLLHVSQLLSYPLDLRSAPARVLEEACNLVPNDEAHLLLLREDRGVFVVTSRDTGARSVGDEIPLPVDCGHLMQIEQSFLLSKTYGSGRDSDYTVVARRLLEGSRRENVRDLQRDVQEWAVLPLRAEQRTIGFLFLGSADGAWDVFEHLATLDSFARQAAATIDQARLRQQQTDMIATAERSRLSRELHDSVLQAIFGCSLGLRTAQHYVDGSNTSAHDALSYSLRLVEGAISEMRALIFELRPETLANEGLYVALQKQAQSLCDRHSIQAAVRSACGEPALVLPTKETFYRIAIEALQNVIKHAHACHVQIDLNEWADCISMTINDDGIGFDTTKDYKGHLGLVSMHERAAQIGAVLMLTSAPGSGTRIDLCVRRG